MAASALDMDMAVSRTTSLHCRQPHSHTCSCFLELVIQVFRLLVHRATLTGPRSCQTRSHTQECPRATQAFNRHKFSLLESQPTCSDNLPTHTNTTCLDSQPTLGCTVPPSQATKTATVFTAHMPSSRIKLTSATISGILGHITSQRDHPCPQPSCDHTLSRHMTITVHAPPTTKPYSQPMSDIVLAHDCLPTETPHSH